MASAYASANALPARAARAISSGPGVCNASNSARSAAGNGRWTAAIDGARRAVEKGEHRIDTVEARAGHHAGEALTAHGQRRKRRRRRYSAPASGEPANDRACAKVGSGGRDAGDEGGPGGRRQRFAVRQRHASADRAPRCRREIRSGGADPSPSRSVRRSRSRHPERRARPASTSGAIRDKCA